MKVIEPYVEVDWVESGADMLKRIERYGRTAYRSEDKITEDSAARFVKMIIVHGHLSVLEHVSVSVRVICDRGVSHEIVRHRIASYTQESTRYCNYAKGKFGGELTFVLPSFLYEGAEAALHTPPGSSTGTLYEQWREAMLDVERTYLCMIALGATPQEARSVCPNSLKTEIVMTMNLREWLHFFSLRTSSAAHPDMKITANQILSEFQGHIPVIFE